MCVGDAAFGGIVVVGGSCPEVVTRQSRPSDRGEQTQFATTLRQQEPPLRERDHHERRHPPASHRDDTTAPPASAETGPVTRIVAGSLAAGGASALVLTLVVFAGATESVITGSVLAGFGLGWALIAALTARYTNRPQRWAVVPAAAMGATGLALVVFTPGDDALTRLELGVAAGRAGAGGAGCSSRSRRVPDRCRTLDAHPRRRRPGASRPSGATYENIAARRDQGSLRRPRRRRYQVGGHRLHLDCRGHGGPTVVLFNGLGEISASWARITGPVGRHHPGLRLRPRRTGLERRRRAPPGRRGRRPGPAHPAGRGR